MLFPVVIYGCEIWTVKKAEHQSIDAFELCCWRRLLRIPWTTRSNQSILMEINHEYSLKGLMLKLKLQFFGHLMQKADSLEKTLMLGKIGGRSREDNRGWDGWVASPTQWTWVWASPGRWWSTGKPGVLQSRGSEELDLTERLNNTTVVKGPWLLTRGLNWLLINPLSALYLCFSIWKSLCPGCPSQFYVLIWCTSKSLFSHQFL